jgi:hypothetical protein
MFDPRFPLSRGERKLFARLQGKLPPDVEVLAAVGLARGPRPGTEALVPFVGVFIDLFVAVLVVLGVTNTRKHYILAATADQAILFRSSWTRRPAEREKVLEFSEVGQINDTVGDPFIELSGERYWISGFSNQVFRLRRVIGAHRSRQRAND